MNGSGSSVVSLGVVVVLVLAGCSGGAVESELVAADGAESVAQEVESTPQPQVEFLPNQVFPAEGIVAGGQPSIEQLEALEEAGYATVINLRTEGEDGTGAAEVEALGMAYVSVPIPGADGLTREEAEAFAAALEAAQGPIAVHCGSGNRVGALFALKGYYVDGMTSEEALEFGRQAGMTRLESAVREHLAAAEADAP